VIHSFKYCLDFLREQVADVDEADLVAQPERDRESPVVGDRAHCIRVSVTRSGDWLTALATA